MRVEQVHIGSFKRLRDVTVDLRDQATGEARSRFLILGDNGSGKTTVLQAIALPLALATGRIRSVDQFDWVGFEAGRYSRWDQPRVELEVSFTQEEIEATHRVAEEWKDAHQPAQYTPPGASHRVTLVLDGASCRAGGAQELYQFCGRHYAVSLLRTNPGIRREFERLPGVFWFDQFRNIGVNTRSGEGPGNGDTNGAGRRSYTAGVENLREYLNGWKLAQQSRPQPYRVDYLANLQNLYKRVFPGRSFSGVEPMPGAGDSPVAKDFYFLLNDGEHDYDISEMSGGEQAVFPILYEVVRQSVAHSVILIDEIDMNLHAPAAQLLVKRLTTIEPTSQFLFTTHSETVSGLMSEDAIFRLPGGTLCL